MSICRRITTLQPGGFSLVELVVGLTLALLLAAVAAPLWLSLQITSTQESDQTILLLQGRVALARLERDLRLAGAAGCPFPVTAPILEATGAQVVFLVRSEKGLAPTIVEWEIAKGALMRRWGLCPQVRPATYGHSLYCDNKTALAGVKDSSALAYVVRGALVKREVSKADLASIDAVVLDVEVSSEGTRGSVRLSTTARVGR